MKKHLRAARIYARLMDTQYNFFGIGFGIESLLGFIPGIGDFLGFILSLYLIWIGYQMNIPAHQLARMMLNIIFDAFIGTVPLVGDIADIFFKANMKNLAILEKYDDETVIEGQVIET
jgi:hypothetical protein